MYDSEEHSLIEKAESRHYAQLHDVEVTGCLKTKHRGKAMPTCFSGPVEREYLFPGEVRVEEADPVVIHGHFGDGLEMFVEIRIVKGIAKDQAETVSQLSIR